jgi:uncharacterized protein (TIGR03067 family)
MDTAHGSYLDGTWQVVRAEYQGESVPKIVADATAIEFSLGQYRIKFDGTDVDQGRFEIIRTTTESMLLLHGTAGVHQDRTIRCIFQHAGDRLRLCYGLDGVKPTEFKTTRRDNRYLAVYRRGH